MSSFGEHLRRQRQLRGISLEEIVAITKISRRHLNALEDEQFELLPGGIFNKSYVRAYARCVGIDEEEAVAEYLEAAHETPPDSKTIAQQHASLHSGRLPERSGFPLVPVLILLVVVAGGVGGWKVYRDRQDEKRQSAPRVSSAESVAPPASSAATTASTPVISEPPPTAPANSSPAGSSSPVATTGGELNTAAPAPAPTVAPPANAAAPPAFEITVRFKERAWISIKADGDNVARGIVSPPQVRTVRAKNQIVFYSSNASALEIVFDGRQVPITSVSTQPETLVFDAHGLLAPKVRAQ